MLKNGKIAIVAAAKLQPVVVRELVTFYLRSINVSAVLTAQIEQVVFAAHLHNFGMITRSHRICDHHVFLGTTANRERKAHKRNRLLLISLDTQQDRKLLSAR